MTTTVTFDIDTDDEQLRALVEDVRHDTVMVWQLAMFCAQQQFEKALKARGVTEHYQRVQRRARATRAAAQPEGAGGHA